MFTHSIVFDPAQSGTLLKQVPAECGVFALHGANGPHSTSNGQPYLTRTANLRRRLTRLLAPPESQSKRLNLRDKVARIDYTVTGSEFESTLLLYRAYAELFSPAEARKRLRLHPPFFVRFAAENAYPRAYVTNRLSKRALVCYYGPFPSRTMAERYLDESLNLFKLRRCHEDLNPDPAFPGCVYSEMKMCLAPCFKGCTEERYAEEAAAVKLYLDTRGESLLTELAAARERASDAMEFEQAAALHAQMLKAKAAAQLADEIVRPITNLNAVILQPAAGERGATADVAIFLVRGGLITGPVLFSTIGMRHPNEQSGSSSLFPHPMALEAVPLLSEGDTPSVGVSSPAVARATLEARLESVIGALEALPTPNGATLTDHLALLRRWYYRPEKQRAGEIFFRDEHDSWKKIMRGISRVFMAGEARR